jgi:hypothetical protein
MTIDDSILVGFGNVEEAAQSYPPCNAISRASGRTWPPR